MTDNNEPRLASFVKSIGITMKRSIDTPSNRRRVVQCTQKQNRLMMFHVSNTVVYSHDLPSRYARYIAVELSKLGFILVIVDVTMPYGLSNVTHTHTNISIFMAMVILVNEVGSQSSRIRRITTSKVDGVRPMQACFVSQSKGSQYRSIDRSFVR
jgi:hypothetical protein